MTTLDEWLENRSMEQANPRVSTWPLNKWCFQAQAHCTEKKCDGFLRHTGDMHETGDRIAYHHRCNKCGAKRFIVGEHYPIITRMRYKI